MAAHKLWSNERKAYIQSLLPNKRILFVNVNGEPKANWNETDGDYDVIIGYCQSSDYYVSINYDLHKGRKSCTLSCITEYISGKEIRVGKRLRNSEKIVYIPSRQMEEFCRNFSYYMKIYNN